MEDQKFLIAALEESVELLQEEVARTKRLNRILRISNGALRRKLNFAAQNDEAFKTFALSDFTIDADDEGGLPDSAPSQS